MSDKLGASKTRRKRDAESLQSLGEKLAAIPREELEPLGLPERLLHAFEELNRMRSHEAIRRQRQFVGRLMREVDPAPLLAFLELRCQPSRTEAQIFRHAEGWRNQMLEKGDTALELFLSSCSSATDGDALRLNATLAAAQAGRSGATRRLFREIRAVLEREHKNNGSPGAAALE